MTYLPVTQDIVVTDKDICESFNCNNEATLEVRVCAGKFGIIKLNLCANCVSKFDGISSYDAEAENGNARNKKVVYES